MRRRHERRWPRIVLGYALFSMLLVSLAAVFYTIVDPSHRALVVRLAVALMLAVVLLHLTNGLRKAYEDLPPSDFERALRGQRPGPRIDPYFGRLHDELRHSAENHSYFDRVLWPRLVVLAERLQGQAGAGLRKPPGRRLRRGPSLDALAAVIDLLERR
jgi:hypothetical protein